MKSSKARRPLISICIPVLNEESNLVELYRELKSLAYKEQKRCRFEFIFTDNNSSDKTWEKLLELSKTDNRIRGFRFSNNIGFQNSIRHGYLSARGHAVVQLDADLQDPPALISEFISKWQEGYKVVSGLRVRRAESFFLNSFRNLGYRLINLLSESNIKRNVGDFRLIDREVVELIRNVKTSSPYLRGIISQFNYPEILIEYSRRIRSKGKSKFGFIKLIKIGVVGLLNHTNVLFKLSFTISTLTLISVLSLTLYLIWARISTGADPSGHAGISFLVLANLSVTCLLLGIVGSYITKIYNLLSGEQKYVILEQI